jgi:fimbrial chaperone protein
MRHHAFLWSTALALAAVAGSVPTRATTVSPMVVDLQTAGRSVVANISVTNTADKPLTMEIAPQALDPTESGLVPGKGSTDDLLVMPPSALIQPGRTQTFRVQWVGDPATAQSRHFFVGINQLPVKLPEGESAVQVVYNFNVLVNVGKAGGKPGLSIQSARIAEKDGKPAVAVTVANGGSTYGYMSQHRLKIVESDASGKQVFSKTISGNEFEQMVGYGIVATGQTRTMVLPLDLPSTTGSLSVTFDDGRGG